MGTASLQNQLRQINYNAVFTINYAIKPQHNGYNNLSSEIHILNVEL